MSKSAFVRGSLAGSLMIAVVSGCSLLLDPDALSGGPPLDLPDARESSASDAPSVDAAPRSLRPAEGTYAYLASGNDFVSLGPTTTPWGPSASATVTHRGADCFTISFTYRARYTESLDFCVRQDTEVVHLATRRAQSFPFLADFITAKSTVTCAPGDVYLTRAPASSGVLTHLCTGENNDDKTGMSLFQTGGPYRFVGTELVTVSGSPVSTFHFREERTVTGAQKGTASADWYFATELLLLVKVTRDVAIATPFTGGAIDYRESSELTLVSPIPTPLPLDAGIVDSSIADAPDGG